MTITEATMRTLLETLTAALLACSALITAPARAQVSSYYMYQDATANGCVARFMHRQTYDGGIAGPAIGGYGVWVKITDTCGGYNDTSNFADMGYCSTGIVYDTARCSVSGVVIRTWRIHANCGFELRAQMDGAAYTGQASAACVGSVLN
ncbi:hypothetical protein [Burkholderia pseudomallei]|uniref:hypothetical protein n=1 Tax=Burkholderia pseudomallei TaxID=28450 RepID=UPI001A0A38F9|nr:hypothetical protein [Burkholderia pseudomallei]MBF3831163.1 hypothetical protein [Burkholderia pseudomallei]